MQDYPIGAIFTDTDGVRLEVVQECGCNGCYYAEDDGGCNDSKLECLAMDRKDSTGVIFRRIAPQTECHFTHRNRVQ